MRTARSRRGSKTRIDLDSQPPRAARHRIRRRPCAAGHPNLLSNAFTGLRTAAHDLSSFPAPARCLVDVVDNGPGVPERARIFDAFVSQDQRHTGSSCRKRTALSRSVVIEPIGVRQNRFRLVCRSPRPSNAHDLGRQAAAALCWCARARAHANASTRRAAALSSVLVRVVRGAHRRYSTEPEVDGRARSSTRAHLPLGLQLALQSPTDGSPG
jgi:hypothetical protein